MSHKGTTTCIVILIYYYLNTITSLPIVIAHRGYSALYPENTLLSIRQACALPSTGGVEIDLHLTLDKQIILQHDEDLDRMTVGGSGRVEDRPWNGYIDQLKTVGGTEEPVTLLSQVLDFLAATLQSQFILVLDVKDDQSLTILNELKKLLDSHSNKFLQIYLGVWRQDFALHARQVFPRSDPILLTLIADEVDLQTVQSPIYDAFNLDVERVTEEIVKEAAKLGKDVLLWTCNSQEQIKRAKELNVHGILTDDPLLIN